MSMERGDDVELCCCCLKWGNERIYRRFISFQKLRYEHGKVKPSDPYRCMIQLTALGLFRSQNVKVGL
jgi:hypothetical protein